MRQVAWQSPDTDLTSTDIRLAASSWGPGASVHQVLGPPADPTPVAATAKYRTCPCGLDGRRRLRIPNRRLRWR